MRESRRTPVLARTGSEFREKNSTVLPARHVSGSQRRAARGKRKPNRAEAAAAQAQLMFALCTASHGAARESADTQLDYDDMMHILYDTMPDQERRKRMHLHRALRREALANSAAAEKPTKAYRYLEATLGFRGKKCVHKVASKLGIMLTGRDTTYADQKRAGTAKRRPVPNTRSGPSKRKKNKNVVKK